MLNHRIQRLGTEGFKGPRWAKFFFSHLPGDSHGMSWGIMLIELSNLKLMVLAYSSHVIGHWMSHVKILLGALSGGGWRRVYDTED